MLIMVALATTVKFVIWILKNIVAAVGATIKFGKWILDTGVSLFTKVLVGTLIIAGIVISISMFWMLVGLIII